MGAKAIILKDWVICGKCGCKLFKRLNNSTAKNIEIKCHQCKEINIVHFQNEVKDEK